MTVNTPEPQGPNPTDPPEGAGQGQQPAGKQYTQAEINQLIESRLTRERAKFADYEALKAKATEHDTLIEQSKTEAQKAIDAARKEGETVADKRWSGVVVGAEARALAATAKFRDPSDAVSFLGDLSSIKIDPIKGVDKAALQAKLNELVTAKPYLLNEDPNPRPAGDAGQGPRPEAGAADMNSLLHGLAKRGSTA